MDSIFSAFIRGLAVLMVYGLISSTVDFFKNEAVENHKRGLLSYKAYSQMLWSQSDRK